MHLLCLSHECNQPRSLCASSFDNVIVSHDDELLELEPPRQHLEKGPRQWQDKFCVITFARLQVFKEIGHIWTSSTAPARHTHHAIYIGFFFP